MRYLLLHRCMCRLLSRAIAPLVSSYFICLLRHLPYSLVVWGPSIRSSHEWLDASGNRPFIPPSLLLYFWHLPYPIVMWHITSPSVAWLFCVLLVFTLDLMFIFDHCILLLT